MLKSLIMAAYIVATPIVIVSEMPLEKEESVVEIIPERPESDELDKVMDEKLQEYVWNLCRSRYEGEELKRYYAAMIGLAEGESSFKANAYHKNSNGSSDRGMWQMNSCWTKELKKLGYISDTDDLYDPYIAAKCADWEFSTCWEKGGGYCELSYSYYLYGRAHKSSKYTRRVWSLMEKWNNELYFEGSK